MTKLLRLLIALLALSIGTPSSAASAQSKPVHVKGHTKKDGTYVAAHDRKAPKKKAKRAPKTAKAARPKATPAPKPPRLTPSEQRSDAVRHAFMRQTGFPNGRPGWIIDHIVPLACGGKDAVSNMQWQTVTAAKAKDKVERRGC